ncbi:MAG: hypothetical protein ACPGVO_15640 [Spirulinaceae cyanobacterium]
MSREILQNIAADIQIFTTSEQKMDFLFVVGALTTRLISLKKAAEILYLDPEALLTILKLMGIEFSYLTENDVDIEQSWQ